MRKRFGWFEIGKNDVWYRFTIDRNNRNSDDDRFKGFETNSIRNLII